MHFQNSFIQLTKAETVKSLPCIFSVSQSTFRRVFTKMTAWVIVRVSYRSQRVSSFHSWRQRYILINTKKRMADTFKNATFNKLLPFYQMNRLCLNMFLLAVARRGCRFQPYTSLIMRSESCSAMCTSKQNADWRQNAAENTKFSWHACYHH